MVALQESGAHILQPFRVRRPYYALLGDYGSYITGGSDVEGRIGCPYACRRNGDSLDMSYLFGASLFNRDLVAAGQGQVNGGGRGGDIARDTVGIGKYRQTVGANLVGGMATG